MKTLTPTLQAGKLSHIQPCALCLPASCSSQVIVQWCSLLNNTTVVVLSHSGPRDCVLLAGCPWLSMELTAMARPTWMSAWTVSGTYFKTSSSKPTSLHTGSLCIPGSISSQPTALLSHCSDRPGCFHPCSPWISLSLPGEALRSEVAAGFQPVS